MNKDLKNFLRQIIIESLSRKKIGLIPMSAKPFHKGHYFLVQEAIKDCDIVYIFYSIKDRMRLGEFPIYGNDAKIYWDNYIKVALPSNVYAIEAQSPVRSVYEYVKDHENEDTEILIYSDYDESIKNYPISDQEKYFGTRFKKGSVKLPGIERNWKRTEKDISGKNVRITLKNDDYEAFKEMIPDIFTEKQKKEIFNLFKH